ncbi:hypothetical protein GUJ93_ZPchr0011g27040 [Zizania palustris]|uniref:Uncharacterized protein n=1 Tax=Zizania palustris TaxID=103762 RepID=A0A8J5WET2_ZIZPA|nr:hypothetical protein GUJ93_ZPchr0011g27040 [Zizania palustris]
MDLGLKYGARPEKVLPLPRAQCERRSSWQASSEVRRGVEGRRRSLPQSNRGPGWRDDASDCRSPECFAFGATPRRAALNGGDGPGLWPTRAWPACGAASAAFPPLAIPRPSAVRSAASAALVTRRCAEPPPARTERREDDRRKPEAAGQNA